MTTIKPATARVERPDDAAERSVQSNVTRLQRAVIKLTFSFYGQNAGLDERLQRLGALMKSSPKSPAVFSLIDDTVDFIVAGGLSRGAPEFAAQQIGELLSLMPDADEPTGEFRSLQRRFAETKEKNELTRLIPTLATYMNTRFAARKRLGDETPQENIGTEPMLRMFSSMRVSGELKDVLDSIRARIEKSHSLRVWLDAADEAAAALSRASLNDSAPTRDNSLSEAKSLLLGLVEQVKGSQPAAGELARVPELVAGATTVVEFATAARIFGEGLLKVRHAQEQELVELGTFLRTVTRRIEDFRSTLSRNGETHLETVENAAVFQRTMLSHVGQMRTSIIDETDLSHLKEIVTGELEGLEGGVNGYISTEQVRHTAAREQVGAMIKRLEDLESETLRLRTDLDEQHTKSLLDPLTGVFNRLGYSEGLAREYSRWQRYGGELSLVMIDLDLFKTINDQFGHAAGDKVLTSVASSLRKQIRNSDLLCRVGGEEFALILPAANVDNAALVAEKLRGGVAASQFRFKDRPVSVTISCGVAGFQQGDSIEEVFERADRALYSAKNQGRNRCCVERAPPVESNESADTLEQASEADLKR